MYAISRRRKAQHEIYLLYCRMGMCCFFRQKHWITALQVQGDSASHVHRGPDVWSASGPAKNWTYKGYELTSMHFTVINPHLGLFGPSKFWTYIQNWTYNHGTYNRAPVYHQFDWTRQFIMLMNFITQKFMLQVSFIVLLVDFVMQWILVLFLSWRFIWCF